MTTYTWHAINIDLELMETEMGRHSNPMLADAATSPQLSSPQVRQMETQQPRSPPLSTIMKYKYIHFCLVYISPFLCFNARRHCYGLFPYRVSPQSILSCLHSCCQVVVIHIPHIR